MINPATDHIANRIFMDGLQMSAPLMRGAGTASRSASLGRPETCPAALTIIDGTGVCPAPEVDSGPSGATIMSQRNPVLLLVLLAAARGQELPRPADHFGFEPGEDRKLASWKDLLSYYGKLDEASAAVTMRPFGTSTERREMVEVVLSDLSPPEIERARALQADVARGRLSGAALGEAASRQPVVVVIQGNLHSTEIASSLLFPTLLHRLATGEDETTKRIRRNVVLVVIPSANPDGLDLVVDWYRRTLDTPWEGTSPPRLYQTYAGHDNNRDWYMLSLKETQAVSRLLYHHWLPEIFLDVHQMGSSGARMFVPPFSDPLNPNVPPALSRLMDLCGNHMALALTRHGCKGIIQDVVFDNWWDGGARSVPVRHNMVGLLTESASARLASPMFLTPGDLKGHGTGFPEHKQQGNFPEPWPGGWWRMSDIVRYQWVSILGLLDLAARYREEFVLGFHDLARQSVQAGRNGPPHAFVIPADQPDRGAVHRLIRNLADTGVEVAKAKAPFTADGVLHPSGTWVVPCAQAFRPHVKDLLEPQVYPVLRASAGGEVIRPYDAAGWTLPMLFGVACRPVSRPLPDDVALDPVPEVAEPESVFSGDPATKVWHLLPDANAAFLLVNRALDAGFPVRRHPVMGRGCFEIEAPVETLRPLAAGLGLRLQAEFQGADRTRPVAKPRVGVYMPWPNSMDAGWTRLVLEEHGFGPALLTAGDVKAGRLDERFDAVVLADIDPKRLRDGAGPGDLPPEFQGGLGVEGAAALRDFVRSGGQLVAFAGSIPFVSDLLGLAVENPLAGKEKDEKDRFVCPGSIVRVVRGESPAPQRDDWAGSAVLEEHAMAHAGFAAPAETAIYLDAAQALRILPAAARTATAELVHPPGDPLLSGWIEGGEKLRGLAALVVADAGAGRAHLFAFRPQHRSQTLGTFRYLFNALHGKSW